MPKPAASQAGGRPTVADAPALTALRRSAGRNLRFRTRLRWLLEHPPRHPPDHRACSGCRLARCCCCRCSWRAARPAGVCPAGGFCPARFAGYEASTHPHWLPFGLSALLPGSAPGDDGALTVLAACWRRRLQLARRRRPASAAAAVAVSCLDALAGYPPGVG